MNRVLFLISVLSISGIVFSGCESKFAESSPESVELKGMPLEKRILEKEKVDSRIDEIQKGADKAKKILEMFRRIQNPSEKGEEYTPFDFLLDVNVELKAKIPENNGEKLVRYGKVVLPIQGLSDECKTIDTFLESGVVNDSQKADLVIGEKLSYSLKTCGSQGQYLEAVVAEWVGNSLEIKIINKNLETILKDLALTEASISSTCKIKQGAKKIIDVISCENFDVKISSNSRAHIKNMTFRNNDDIRFESIADIFENGKLKAFSQIKVNSNGEIKFDLKKVDNPNLNSNTQQ